MDSRSQKNHKKTKTINTINFIISPCVFSYYPLKQVLQIHWSQSYSKYISMWLRGILFQLSHVLYGMWSAVGYNLHLKNFIKLSNLLTERTWRRLCQKRRLRNNVDICFVFLFFLLLQTIISCLLFQHSYICTYLLESFTDILIIPASIGKFSLKL